MPLNKYALAYPATGSLQCSQIHNCNLANQMLKKYLNLVATMVYGVWELAMQCNMEK